MLRCALSIVAALCIAHPAFAFVTFHDNEEHGGKPAWVGAMGVQSHVASVLNAPGRVHWRDRGSTGFGTDHHTIVAGYRGDASDLNSLLKTITELPHAAPAEVVLLPGGGAVLGQKGRVTCHWRARMVYVNVYDPKVRAAGSPEETFTVRVEVFIPDLPTPATPASAERLAKWIAELDDDRFAVREQALRALTQQGAAATAALRDALETTPTAEQRRRLEQLLEQSTALRLMDLRIPKGLAVVSFDSLLAREKNGRWTAQPATIWEASSRLHDAVEGSEDVLLVVAAMLDEKALAALIQKTKDAPKDYLLTFKPLLDLPEDFHANRARHAACYIELRKRLDQFCREAQP